MDEFRKEYLQDITASTSSVLAGRRIVLAISGSVAALETPRLARQLMRHGADVWVCMSDAAADLIAPEALQWCTGNPVVTKLSGWVEHLFLAGDWNGRGDLLLVAPATANTIGKMAHGIDDTVVTTVATTAIGAGLPVLVAPGMHAVMARHPAFLENLEKLRSMGVEVVESVEAEHKAKMADVDTIVEAVRQRLARAGDLAGKRVVITAGPTVEYLDPVRVVTNLSSGKMGVALAAAAWRRGADVTLIYGPGSAAPPVGVSVVHTMTTEQMHALHEALTRAAADFVVLAAAVSDYRPVAPADEKISTRDGRLTLELEPTPKIVKAARGWTKGCLVGFKAETTSHVDDLCERARGLIEASGADVVVANSVGAGRGFLADHNEVYVVSAGNEAVHLGPAPKPALADRIWDTLLSPF
jgi:phosphopantothenoylcysteine decarboxylase/phosphopantothenate--cysteine ligase